MNSNIPKEIHDALKNVSQREKKENTQFRKHTLMTPTDSTL